MACSVFAVGDTLHIMGDAADDTITVRDDGAHTISGDATGFGAFTVPGIRNIVVDSGAGDDAVTYWLEGDLQSGVTRKVDVGLRDGNDRFFASLYSAPMQKFSDFRDSSLLLMSVKAHDGNDDLTFDAGGGVDMDHATMKIWFHGNAGDDNIHMRYAGVNWHGGVTFFGWGGDGNDRIGLFLFADPQSIAPDPGGFRAHAYGEAGDDTLYLFVDAPEDVSTWNTLIDGGDDTDTGIGNIKNIVNCELS